jgi:hypothetical protein
MLVVALRVTLRAMMFHRSVFLVSAIMIAATLYATEASGHGMRTVTIRHQMKACHAWSFDGGPYRGSLRMHVDPATFVRFSNDDMMPHRLVQLSGPKVRIKGANMSRMGAKAQFLLGGRGVYRFRTFAGKEYAWAPPDATGPDHALRLTVVVK